MDKFVELLKALLPADQVKAVAEAVDVMLGEARKQLEAEFNQKLQEGYAQMTTELAKAEQVAEKGYAEAFGYITDLRNRMEQMREEYEAQLDEGYEEAYGMILAEREKNTDLERRLYEEYEGKLTEMKKYVVEKVDQFLQFKGAEIYEQAKRDILSDPRMAEYKVVLDKIIDNVATYLDVEDRTIATSSKLEEAYRAIEDLKGQLRLMEARSIRTDADNRKLKESVTRQATKITESTQADRNARAQKAQNVTGRGRIVEDAQVEVIKEHNSAPGTKTNDDTVAVLSEGFGDVDVATLQALSGITEMKAKQAAAKATK